MELYQEELEEEQRQKERSALEAQIRQRLDLQQANKDYLELKARKEEAQRIEEQEFRQQVHIELHISWHSVFQYYIV